MPVHFNKDTKVKDVLQQNPKTADVLKEMGLQCLGCPSSANESLEGAATMHNMDLQKLLDSLNQLEYGEMSATTAAGAQPKGAVLQRDKETFAIAPHIPGGITDPATLRKIADVAEKYNAACIKATSAQRLAIVGIKKEDVDKAWADLGMDPGHAVGLCVRSVKFCPGTTFCKRGQQDAVALGYELDKRYHGLDLPSKFKMGVSGCPNKCTDSATIDLGIMGTSKGYHIYVGGNGGVKPRLADLLVEHAHPCEVLGIVDRVIQYYKSNAKGQERLGRMLDRIGIDGLKKFAFEDRPVQDCVD
jgi:hybrid cluster-associated redox disulfide protein